MLSTKPNFPHFTASTLCSSTGLTGVWRVILTLSARGLLIIGIIGVDASGFARSHV
ncbi:MAG: hypothetical protein J07HQW1_01546 [Haloquadratum walsbyi J07HQW1]|uniref:Uncharacterized protein n=1 Tax=Haloquadratum walsbyi J07HQW1 TaxID=1238424 RepID=U1PD59_9EURY|nr:MAG: hypothetical protein J07HQW1_01546 [Haloquadratum walsbyi J07HQW1]